MERTVAAAVLQEKSRRLEAELDLERLQARVNASAFTSQEESEFQHFYTKLKEPVEVYRPVYITGEVNGKSQSIGVGRCRFKVPFIEPLVANVKKEHKEFWRGCLDDFWEVFETATCLSSLPEGSESLANVYFEQDLTSKLLILGLVKEQKNESQVGRFGNLSSYSYRFTEKMYRFVSWIDYYNKVGDSFSVELIGFVEKSSYKAER